MTIKEIKQDAKLRTKGKYFNLIIINVIYALILSAFTFATTIIAGDNDASVLKVILSIFILAIILPFSYGVLVSTIKLTRGEAASSTEFINIGLKNIGKVWKLTLRMLSKLVLPVIFMIVSFLLASITSVATNFGAPSFLISLSPIFLIIFFASYIYLMVKALSYTLSNYLLYDKPELTSKEILNESEKIMKGNKWNYIGLVISFIGWYLLIALLSYFLQAKFSISLGTVVEFILTAFLSPYVSASQIVFYEDLASNIAEK